MQTNDACHTVGLRTRRYIGAALYRAAGAHGVRPFHWGFHDELQQLEDGISVEWRHPRVELIKDAAKRPEVRIVVIGLLLQQLRGHVQRRSLDGRQHERGLTHGPGKSDTTKRRHVSFELPTQTCLCWTERFTQSRTASPCCFSPTEYFVVSYLDGGYDVSANSAAL